MLHERLARYLEGRGGAVRRRALAEAVEVEAGRVTGVRYLQRARSRDEIRAGARPVTERLAAEAVVAAVPWKAVPKLVPEALRGERPFAELARLEGSPIVSIEMWLDRVVVDRTMVGLRDSEIEWVFDKGRLYGRLGAPQHLAFIASAAYRSVPRPNAELVAAAEAALRRYFPAMSSATVTRSLVMREPDATFASDPEAEALRPGTDDARPGPLPGRGLDRHRPARHHRGRGPQRLRGGARGGGHAVSHPFPWARWAALVWLAVWAPTYAAVYGFGNFVHICDVAVILTGVGLWRASPLLLSMQALNILIDLAWDLDLGWRLATGRHLLGGTEYMWERSTRSGCACSPSSTWPCPWCCSGPCGGWATTGARWPRSPSSASRSSREAAPWTRKST